MPIKSDSHIFSGMLRDYDIAKHQSLFLYDAKNIRFTPIEGDTMLALTNERGPLEQYTLSGKYLGHCVFNDFVVIFTKGDNDNIYKVTPKEDLPVKLLYYGNLNFNLDNPIEALGVYENDYLSKVYLVDGLNLPRVIKLITPKEGEQEYDYQSRILPNNQGIDTLFDFVASLSLNEDITVSRVFGEGMFAPGVIQYAFAYYKLNGQESNIFYTTPLNYITFIDRAGNPEERVANSFRIIINNLEDDKFDFIRIFSIHRTSYNAVPTVKKVSDINLSKVENHGLIYIDDGTMGDIIDPTELLYIGGELIIANTLTSKDKTLFLGNLKITRQELSENDIEIKEEDSNYQMFSTFLASHEVLNKGINSGYYHYTNSSLSSSNRGFKNREHYRLGILFLHRTGKWSIPIFLKDYTVTTLNNEGPDFILYDDYAEFRNLEISGNIKIKSDSLSKILNDYEYVKYRPVCVFPTIKDRLVLTLGVLCPTVYNYNNRILDAPFSLSSWFFRLNPNKSISEYGSDYTLSSADWIEFRHNHLLRSEYTLGGEVLGLNRDILGISAWSDPSSPEEMPYITAEQISNKKIAYAVDLSILTFHSPDIEYDDDIEFMTDNTWKLKLVGIANFDSLYGDISIETSSPSFNGIGFNHYIIGYYNTDDVFKGLYSSTTWRDGLIGMQDQNDLIGYGSVGQTTFVVYPWLRSGSLNNDIKRGSGNGARTAVLLNKILANLKFSSKNTWFTDPLSEFPYYYDITPITVFNSDLMSLSRLLNTNPFDNDTIPYYGNIDTLINVNKSSYRSKVLTSLGSIEGTASSSGTYNILNSSVINTRMKYKSSKHIVFGIHNKLEGKNKRSTVLPTINNIEPTSVDTTTDITYVPNWYSKTRDKDVTSTNIVDAYVSQSGNLEDFNTWKQSRISVWEANYQLYDNKIIASFSHGAYNEGCIGIIYRLSRLVTSTGQHWEHFTITNSEYSYYTYNLYTYKYIGQSQILLKSESVSLLNNNIQELLAPSDIIPYLGNILLSSLDYPYLFIGELVRLPNADTDFGGTTTDAKLHNIWLPAGEPLNLPQPSNGEWSELHLNYDQGDTWYTRYDCLKTYPFTEEDENSIIEVGSFMCESRINGDGRYDKNRGEINNILNFRPTNFNLLNPVYSLHNNFFSYKILDSTLATLDLLPNTITWSKENPNGNDIDLWTNITMANTLDLDGVLGLIQSLLLFNDKIICFQDTAISNILFNSRVQIPVSDGVPIEISNGLKVDGSVYISTTYGCNNKWSIAITPSGIYFVDTTSKQLMNLGEGISSVSGTHGFSEWFRSKDNHLTLKTSYDFINNDLYLNWDDTSLIFNETLGLFTSFMSYEKSHSMFNIGNDTLCLRDDNSNCKVYKMFSGDYCTFFGLKLDYWIQFISNQDSSLDKTFLNIESRIDFKNGGVYMPKKYFDYIRVSNEYQDTQDTNITTNKVRVTNPHISGRKKFRIWRTEIPRAFDVDKDRRTLDRIRNTWASIKLRMDSLKEDDNWGNTQMIMHDLEVLYFI